MTSTSNALPHALTPAMRNRLSRSSALVKTLDASDSTFMFARYPIDTREIFYLSPLSYGFVNYKPILPGHVLISPRRVVPRVQDLTEEEAADLILSAQAIGVLMQSEHSKNALNISIQDGPDAGQTVPHVHIHILPRAKTDFSRNDEVFERLDAHDSTPQSGSESATAKPNGVPADEERESAVQMKRLFTQRKPMSPVFYVLLCRPRTPEDMYKEAAKLRSAIQEALCATQAD